MHRFIYSIAGTDIYNYFDLDSSTGELTLRRSVDYDDLVLRGIVTTFTLTLEARDSGFPQRITTIDVDIEITNVDDTPPRCTPSSPVGITLSESPVAADGDVVGVM